MLFLGPNLIETISKLGYPKDPYWVLYFFSCIYINDIVSEIQSNIRLFADDTSLYVIVQNPDSAALCLNVDLNKIFNWAKLWLVKFNYSKTESMVISRKVNKPYHPPVYMDNAEMKEVSAHKHLGIFFSNDCSWHTHIDYIKE